ncbi:MAG: hypothetical protein HC849_30715 [Oscillatoriales cyanobacterium RU_3_3]|nr:hypothetical protein [Microcoleus sp. SU_5_6]NJL68768.1 hypothetical protein [Microcoleus sp. SM1_3_4]NJM63551.1 hypothetical protein [Oscillatoriales cyanobacterium RU_3_3]NJR23091.1 hypothetical protein [Richelia sp. CSU_2_1]
MRDSREPKHLLNNLFADIRVRSSEVLKLNCQLLITNYQLPITNIYVKFSTSI